MKFLSRYIFCSLRTCYYATIEWFYINIKFKAGIGLDKAKEVANLTLEKFDEDEKKFYDIGYYLTQEDESEEKKGFVVTGTKNAKLDTISWIKS